MRLEKIKLAGFKSFVDPTTVSFPSNLVGIVGPNGCGKSNVIDAVRWVMGESSAKMLRGESMADVIFNGSSSRKPVGTASIELIFDNADGSAGGQYAQYADISVKRQVSRDGQSVYFLNGVRCRRRDITDLFLGTGLGPRSYSIIEQGMISRIIEARPEDLRVYLEEAAGISKYKERRRETENRMSHTRENLERLDDLREEVQKQLRHLERQAATAQKYKTLRDEERRTRAELLVLRLMGMQDDIEQRDRAIADQQNRLEKALADQRSVEAEIEQQRSAHAESNDRFNEVQGRYYAVGSDIARLEESIQFAREARRRQQGDLEQARHALAQAQALSSQDSNRLAELAMELERDQPMLDAARAEAEQAAATQQDAEQGMQAWQNDWDRFNQEANEPGQQAQVERTRINHLEAQETQLRRRLSRCEEEQRNLADISLEAEIAELQQREAAAESAVQTARAGVDAKVTAITELRERSGQTQESLATARTELETVRGRLASLQALQQAARDDGDEELARWLEQQALGDRRRALEVLEVDPQWQTAVEVVLGERLQSVLTEDSAASVDELDAISSGNLTLVDDAAPQPTIQAGSLAEVVKGPAAMMAWLNAVILVDDVAEAVARRSELAAGQSFVTPAGVRIGRDWVAVRRGADGSAGVLAREQELRELATQRERLEPQVEELASRLTQDRDALVAAEQARETEQVAFEAAQRALSELRALLSGKQARAEQIRHRVDGLVQDATELKQQIEDGSVEMDAARKRLHAALASIEDLAKQREQRVAQRDALRQRLDAAREAANAARNAMHEIALRVESMRSSEDSLRSGIGRMQSQLSELQTRCGELEASVATSQAPIDEQQGKLEQHLGERSEVEAALAQARQQLEAIDHRLRELEQSRHGSEQQVQQERSRLDQARMARQEIVVRGRTLEEQLAESGFDQGSLRSELADDADADAWQQQVESLANRIQRLDQSRGDRRV
jgi:chromosome segregation protein